MRKINFQDKDIPLLLIIYATVTVIVAVFAPAKTPESVRISILVSSQTALGGAAGMSRVGENGKEINNRIETVEKLEENTNNYISSENSETYK